MTKDRTRRSSAPVSNVTSSRAGDRPHILLATVGSAGDVHPFVGLGIRLRERGDRVTVITSGYFRSLVERAGLEFIDSTPGEDFQTKLRDPRIWDRLRGPRAVMEMAVQPQLEPIYRAIVEQAQAGPVLAAASSLALGARVAQDKWGIPTVTVHLSPALFRSDAEGPTLPGLMVDRGPWWFKRAQWLLADHLYIDRMICPWLNAFRRRLALPPVRRVYQSWWHSPLKVLGMFPEWFAAKQFDWPAQTSLTGFPLYDECGVTAPSPELQAFLAQGAAPLVFTPGSANLFGHAFFAAAVEACQRLDRRGILLTRFPEQAPSTLPATVKHFDFVPFGWLLPRAALLVHHGGVGTMSQALAAGIPQIVMPLAFDQFDNIARVERLGVGRSLLPQAFQGARLATLVSQLCDDPLVKVACERTASRFQEQDGLQAACDAIDAAWRQANPSKAEGGKPNAG